MKKLIALAVMTLAAQVAGTFAGEPMVSSKQVIAPPPPAPPEFFRPNEFDIGAFATYAGFSGTHEGNVHGWGGGIDLTYWFPWKYAGVRFQGTGLDFSSSKGERTRTVTFPDGSTQTLRGGGGSVAAGVITADVLLRLPLDDFWPGVHLAPYAFGGFGGILLGGGGNGETFSKTVFVSSTQGAPANTPVTFTGRRVNNIRNNIGTDRVLGHIGGGLEYRFTPHIGLFTEASYNIVDGSSNNFWQWNFVGLRYAF